MGTWLNFPCQHNLPQNYSTVSKWIPTILDIAYMDADGRKQFQNSKDFKEFVKKWPVSVYYSLRHQHVVGAMEEALENVVEFENSQSASNGDRGKFEWHNTNWAMSDPCFQLDNSPFKLHISSLVFQLLRESWLPEVFLTVLVHKFWRLTLQIIVRYKTFWMSIDDDQDSVCAHCYDSHPDHKHTNYWLPWNSLVTRPTLVNTTPMERSRTYRAAFNG